VRQKWSRRVLERMRIGCGLRRLSSFESAPATVPIQRQYKIDLMHTTAKSVDLEL